MWTKKEVNQLAYHIIGCAIEVHKALGPGLLESVYEECLKYELEERGYEVKSQINIPIYYRELVFDTELRLDLLIEDCIVVELKATEKVNPVHEAKLMSYMKMLAKPKGIMINFFTENITKSAKHFVNEYFAELPEE